MADISKIKTVIFDLGGVLLNLDLPATYRAFAQLSGRTLEEVKALTADQQFFDDYETGKIDDPTFRANIRETLEILNEDEEIDAAWCAMLRVIPKERLQLLNKMGADYQIFMMSNTNDIHWRQILKIARCATPEKELPDYFDQIYLSQEVGERKPNPGAWQPILDDHNIDPATSLFIDDRQDNLDGAASLGIQTFHNVQPDDWMGLFTS